MSLDRNREIVILEGIFEMVVFCQSQYIEANARGSVSHQIHVSSDPRRLESAEDSVVIRI